jgi:predicted NUDIX family phosphoesterase
VDEEISVNTAHTDRIVGLLNDDSNEVGQVHLGVVHHWRLAQPAVEKREQMITNLGFLSADDLRAIRDRMETWSQLCLDHIEQIAR